ncbi:MAG: Fe-S cluster assembly protein SufD [Legionellales bacterium RIFCSPHIGHO2_12_FULL_35_11]|nr:MAG: Fe-S cluster assembly protein SufD [Legionellales bacterium RIFCSPHIGHO2_12_FULL_35_11]
MNEAYSFYQKQALDLVAKNAYLAELQTKALADFAKLGFPSKGNEAWKYTKVDGFLKHFFTQERSQSLSSHAIEIVATGRQSDSPIGLKIPIINGVAMGLEALQKKLPTGVIVKPLTLAVDENIDKVKPYLDKILSHENGFQSLNSAMLAAGLFIYIPANVVMVEPLLLAHLQASANEATYLRHLIVAEEGSDISIIEDYQGDVAANYFTNAITEIFAAQNAEVKHLKIQRESSNAFHFGHVVAKQAANSNFTSHLMQLGGCWSRSDLTISLEEKKSTCLLNGIYAPRKKQHMDSHTLVRHLAPDCSSWQDYRGIVNDSAKAVFNGQVYVAREAKSTKAQQQNKNLLLANTAEINTLPQLNIYTDDVLCTHGATIGELDKDALFYFVTRGIDEADARRYLLQAFVSENLNVMANNTLSTWISGLLSQQIG